MAIHASRRLGARLVASPAPRLPGVQGEGSQALIVSEHITCDVCGIAKGETNHWLMCVAPVAPVATVLEGIVFAPICTRIADEARRYVKVEHLCGHACAHKRLGQWLESITASATERHQS